MFINIQKLVLFSIALTFQCHLTKCRRILTKTNQQDLTSNANCPSKSEKPKITILSDSDDFMAGVGKIIIEKTLILQCVASYPIYWSFIPPTASTYDIFSKVSRSNCYNETLTLLFTPAVSAYGRTGNYTCISGLDGTVASWVYLHIRDNQDLFRRILHIHDYADSVEEQYWSIPCFSTVKTLENPQLFTNTSINGTNEKSLVGKDDIETLEEPLAIYDEYGVMENRSLYSIDPTVATKPVKLNMTEVKFTKFDPVHGFLLEKSKFPRPHGAFQCRGKFGDAVDEFNITLKNYNVYPTSDFVHYSNNNTIEIMCEYDEDITLDLTKSYMLKKISETTTSRKSFKYSKRWILQEQGNITIVPYYQRNLVRNTSGVISCVTQSSNKIIHSWNHDVSKTVKCVFSTYSKDVVTGESDPLSSSSHYGTYDGVRGTCDNVLGHSVYCLYTDTVTKAKNDLAQQHYHILNRIDTKYFSSIGRYSHNNKTYVTTTIRCQTYTPIYTTFISLVAGLSGYEVNPPQIDEAKNLKMYIRKNEIVQYLVGDIMEIWCLASRYVFSDSMRWTLNYKNGTSIPIEPLDFMGIGNSTILDRLSNPQQKVPQQWAFLERIHVELNEYLQSVSCSSIVWNSTKTITTSYSVELNITNSNKESYKIITANDMLKCDKTSVHPVIKMLRKPTGNYRLQKRLAGHLVTDKTVFLPYGTGREFLCLADYPIEWTYEGSPTTSSFSRIDSSSENGTKKDFSPCFQSKYTTSVYQVTGEYVCRKKNDDTVFSTIYIFTRGLSASGRLTNAGSHIDVIVDQSNPTTIFPCRVNDPDVSVDLHYHIGPGVYRKLEDAEFESYDPKKGFYMKTSLIKKGAVYICTLSNSTDPLTSITISIKMLGETKTPAKVEMKANSLLQPNMVSTDSELSEKMDKNRSEFLSMQIIIVVALIAGIGLLAWLIRRQQQNTENTSRALGSYIQLNNSL